MGVNVWSSVPADMPLVIQAMIFAERKHRGQTRKWTGEPYVVHVMNVARMVAAHTMDPHIVCAAILHDTVEDTDTTFDEIFSEFGIRVTEMVRALTNVDHSHGNRKTRKAIDASRLEHAGSDVQMIKIFDIIDNWETISRHDPKFAVVFKSEVMELVSSFVDVDPHLRMVFDAAMSD